MWTFICETGTRDRCACVLAKSVCRAFLCIARACSCILLFVSMLSPHTAAALTNGFQHAYIREFRISFHTVRLEKTRQAVLQQTSTCLAHVSSKHRHASRKYLVWNMSAFARCTPSLSWGKAKPLWAIILGEPSDFRVQKTSQARLRQGERYPVFVLWSCMCTIVQEGCILRKMSWCACMYAHSTSPWRQHKCYYLFQRIIFTYTLSVFAYKLSVSLRTHSVCAWPQKPRLRCEP